MPPTSFPVVDIRTGTITQPWYRAWVGLFLRTGGADGVNSTDVQATVAEALATAQSAQASANLALTDALHAQSTADTAAAAAASAQVTANAAASSATGAATNALTKANNLNDVQNAATSRANLGVNVVPIVFTFDTLPSGLTRYVPIIQNLSIGANFANAVTYAGVTGTVDAIFTVQRIRAGTTSTLGTITVVHSGAGTVYTASPFSLVTGDVFVVKCPNPADATLANVGMTFSATLT